MHGQITLESEIGRGTKATFWIPFNRPQFTGTASPLVDLGSIPDRLRSDMSVSGCPSERRSGGETPPISPLIDSSGLVVAHQPKGVSKHGINTSLSGEEAVPEVDRKNVHVLVVEDK